MLMRRKTRRIFTVFLILVVVAGYALWPRHHAKPVQLLTIQKGSISESVLATGQILPRRGIQVKSQVPGSVGKLFVKEGDLVKAGQVLMLITPTATPQDIAQDVSQVNIAKAAFHKDKEIFKRDKQLLLTGAITQQTYDIDESAVKTDYANLQLATQNLSLLKKGSAKIDNQKVESNVVSPISGYVLSITVNQGDSITANTPYQSGTTLVVLADMNDLVFRGQVSQMDIGKLKLGLPATLQVAALPDLKLNGSITQIALQSAQAQAQQQAQNGGVQTLFSAPSTLQDGFAIEISGFQLPAGTFLRAGYQATATIQAKQVKDVLVVPQTALRFDNGKPYVRLPAANPKEKPTKQFVTLGLTNAQAAQVLGGLTAGEKILP